MSDYADTPDPEACFDAAGAGLEDLICAARSHGRCGDWSAEAAETAVIGDTRAVALAVLQGFFDTQQGVARLWRSPGLACFRFDCVRRGSSPIVVFGRGRL
ncbi:hypothetical protein ACFQ9X_31760 [Catenulispora yoronensis]